MPYCWLCDGGQQQARSTPRSGESKARGSPWNLQKGPALPTPEFSSVLDSDLQNCSESVLL